jgi:hypothetical protein
VDEQAVFDAISSDPDQVNDAINDGASAPTAKSICDALGIENHHRHVPEHLPAGLLTRSVGKPVSAATPRFRPKEQ